MRRLILGPAAYLAALWGTIVRGWNTFFFKPADPTALGLIRLVVGWLALWSLGVYGLDLQGFLGSRGWSDPEIVQRFWLEQSPNAWSFWLWVPDSLLRPVWVVCMVILALFTAGLWSRVTAVLTWVVVISTVRRSPTTMFGFDQIMTMLTLYLAVTGASGLAVSLDRFLARWRAARAAVARRRQDGRWVVPSGVPLPTISANLALRLIQLHLCLIYGAAGLAKLRGPQWWDGTAIWGLLTAAEFNQLDLTWLASYPYVLNFLTHTTIALEVGYPVLIWVRPLRPLVLFGMVLLHIGIGLSAPGLTVFAVAMLAGNIAFVPGPWLRSLVSGLRQPSGRVLYDGACPRCRASMALLTAADPDRVIEPVDLTAVNVAAIHPSLTKERCLASMHLVRADGKVLAGYDAVMTILAWTPLTWPALVRHVPSSSDRASGLPEDRRLRLGARRDLQRRGLRAPSARRPPHPREGDTREDRPRSLDLAENETETTPTWRRLFLFEPGRRTRSRAAASREFCYTTRRARTIIIACLTARFTCSRPTSGSASPARAVAACSPSTRRGSATRSRA